MMTNLREAENELAQATLARIATGDAKAMEDFYRTFSRIVYAFVMRRLENPVTSEEVVVETMYEVWRSAGAFAGRSAPRSWLLGIARHKLIDKQRAWDSNPVEELDEEAENVASNDPSAFDHLSQQQTREQIQNCLGTLPDEQSECMHLMFYEDMSINEIAGIQNCPENTIKTRLFHARKKLKLCLERQTRWLR
jgi:RNA polymerase sigma-70 factor (ECF subfamily)